MAPDRLTAKRMATALLVCLALPDATSAATPPTRAPAVQVVIDCRKLGDSAQRLACYDKAVDGMADAEAKGDLVTIDREQRRAVRRQTFGLTLPSLTIFDRGEKPEEMDNITATVASASLDLRHNWVIRLDDGAMWRQTDEQELFKPPHAGSKVRIRKGVLGAFFLNVDGQSAIRAHREN